MAVTMRRATLADVPEVLRLLNERAVWIQEKGLPQWGGGFPEERIASIVARGGTFLAADALGPVATITVSPQGDSDFWTTAELLEPAWYVTKMATSRERGKGLGSWMLSWVIDKAFAAGITWVRLDVWRTNTSLRAWYAAQGWEHIRTVEAPGRNSGALFRHRAQPDPVAARMFAGRPRWLERTLRPILPGGTRVQAGGYGPGTITVASEASYGYAVAGHVPEYPQRLYTVRLDDGRLIDCRDADLELAEAEEPEWMKCAG